MTAEMQGDLSVKLEDGNVVIVATDVVSVTNIILTLERASHLTTLLMMAIQKAEGEQ